MNDLDKWIEKTGYLSSPPKGYSCWSDWIGSNPKNPPEGFENWIKWNNFLDSIKEKVNKYYQKKSEGKGILHSNTNWCIAYVNELRCNFNIAFSCTRDTKSIIGIEKEDLKTILVDGSTFISTMDTTNKTIKWIILNKDKAESIQKWIKNSIDITDSKIQTTLSHYTKKDIIFVYDIEEILDTLVKKGSISSLEFEIYRKISLKMQSANDILKASIEFDSIYQIKKLYKRVIGAINDLIGERYELWLFPILNAKYRKVKYDGRSGKPDFEFFDENGIKCFMSVKCLEFSKDYRLNIEEHNAEIIAAIEYYKTSGNIPRLIVHVYNRYTNKITEFELPSYIITGEMPKSTLVKV